MIEITRELALKLAPQAKTVYLDALANSAEVLQKYDITTSLRVAHFMAQAFHETGGLTVLTESLNYTHPERIMEIFGIGHHSAAVLPAEAEKLARNPPALAERVYGAGNPKKAQELGNTQPGDGWRFIGRGFIQITGRGAYERYGRALGIPLTDNPDLAIDPRYSLSIGAVEWQASRCNVHADADDLVHVTRAINGGLIGLDDRRIWLTKWKAALRS